MNKYLVLITYRVAGQGIASAATTTEVTTSLSCAELLQQVRQPLTKLCLTVDVSVVPLGAV